MPVCIILENTYRGDNCYFACPASIPLRLVTEAWMLLENLPPQTPYFNGINSTLISRGEQPEHHFLLLQFRDETVTQVNQIGTFLIKKKKTPFMGYLQYAQPCSEHFTSIHTFRICDPTGRAVLHQPLYRYRSEGLIRIHWQHTAARDRTGFCTWAMWGETPCSQPLYNTPVPWEHLEKRHSLSHCEHVPGAGMLQ